MKNKMLRVLVLLTTMPLLPTSPSWGQAPNSDKLTSATSSTPTAPVAPTAVPAPESEKITDGGLKSSLDWEFYANASNKPKKRKPQHFTMAHYDVPVRLLSYDFEIPGAVTEKIKQSLFFDKTVDGKTEKYVRWIINPEDTKYHTQVQNLLKFHNLDTTAKHYFQGHLTASRSMYVEDTSNGNVFSAKVGTNHTGGKWTSEKYLDLFQLQDSEYASRLAAYVNRNNNVQMNTATLMPEPLGLFIDQSYKWGPGSKIKRSLQQGMLIRDISAILAPDHYYLPGFTALNEKVGKEIANANGSDDPKTFWTQNYVIPLAKAFAEFTAYHGISMTSSHNQQFLIELDSKKKPTGKIIFRDFNDAHTVNPFFKDAEDPFLTKFVEYWKHEGDRYSKEYLLVQLGIFHGTKLPSWINPATDVPAITKTFFDTFEEEFGKITGIHGKEMRTLKLHFRKPPGYSTRTYRALEPLTGHWTAGWKNYFQYSECFRGAIKTRDGKLCKNILKKLAAKSGKSFSMKKERTAAACALADYKAKNPTTGFFDKLKALTSSSQNAAAAVSQSTDSGASAATHGVSTSTSSSNSGNSGHAGPSGSGPSSSAFSGIAASAGSGTGTNSTPAATP